MGLFGDLFSIGSSIIGGSSAKKASRAAQQAQIAGLNNAVGSVNSGYNDVVSSLSPYTGSGAGAQDQINALLGISTAGTPGAIDYAAYVNANPDLVSDWQSKHSGMSAEQYGQWHYNTYGQYEPQRGAIDQYRTGGTAGFDGAAAQGDAIKALQASPLYQSLYRTGQEAVLQNASATGGLRGGNIQSSLANFGSDTLAKVIQQQLANLGGVAQNGLSAATGQANAAGDRSAALAQLMAKIGDTNAGGILQRSTINSNMLDQIAKSAGSIADGGQVGKLVSKVAGLF